MASDFQCGKCGGSISKTDEYCSSCGAKIIQHSDGLPGIIPGVTKWNFVVVAFYVFVVVPLFVTRSQS
ncbi:hypothetical protein [Haloarcula sp. JP-L23]|uniref:hypothetical protein n=1 Tax=Haloarcula sp. JP-L23 TaxID=2716717 RepID=UPI00140F0BFE|nr:hypothetical protein G9465_22675 [Haloarcula sp. JP-L23]